MRPRRKRESIPEARHDVFREHLIARFAESASHHRIPDVLTHFRNRSPGPPKRGTPPLHSVAVLAAVLISMLGCSPAPDSAKGPESLVQDTLYYLDNSTARRELVTEEQRAYLHEKFLRLYYSPWRRDLPVTNRSDIEAEIHGFRKNPGYGENRRRHTAAWVPELERNMDLKTYPNASFKAIATVNTDLRVLPTLKPHFNGLKDTSRSYPFDNLQNSAIHANSPLFVTHVAADRSWLLVESSSGHGWAPARDVARVDDDFIQIWAHSDQVAIIKDPTPVYLADGTFVFKVGLGAQFPGRIENETHCRILVAMPDERMRAVIHEALVPRGAAIAKPLPLTAENIARLAAELLNKPYGWGGIYHNRDCSSTLKDLFAPFDLWLPRHSSQQALEGGAFVRLRGLTDEAKEAAIVRTGVPFATLLWAKGHIMLYIGSLQKQAVVFHNTWGIKTLDAQGKKGRKIIGKTVIGSLHPGAGLPNADLTKGDLITRIEGMTFLLPGSAPPGSPAASAPGGNGMQTSGNGIQ